IVSVYGGPHVQRVNNSWSQNADMRAQRLRSLGFCVVKCDNRGGSRRGRLFELEVKGDMGNKEVEDQVDCVDHVTRVLKVGDAKRVGIVGWSYGGYMAAMCLSKEPNVFHAAVSGAPVTTWRAYDTHYTERYMGLPAENKEGYERSSVMNHSHNIKGSLMLVHGMVDENVHFGHTTRLINKLVEDMIPYELLLFPTERHSPRGTKGRAYMEERIGDFFMKNVKKREVGGGKGIFGGFLGG
ncbi:hypothetical protein TrRE_jg6806, partial [Triparma retinervis]